jgi:hypothetical protein
VEIGYVEGFELIMGGNSAAIFADLTSTLGSFRMALPQSSEVLIRLTPHCKVIYYRLC